MNNNIKYSNKDQQYSYKNEINNETETFLLYIIQKIYSLPILAIQLKESIKYTEDAVENISSSFLNINQKQKLLTNDITGIIDNLSLDSNNDSLLNLNKLVLKDINKNISEVENIQKKMLENNSSILNKIEIINNKMKPMKKIAKRTQIISLNAMVEAVRAGKNGRAFTIVANEVRELSEKSDLIVKEINEIINNLLIDSKKIHEKNNDDFSYVTKIIEKSQNEIINMIMKLDFNIKNLKNKLKKISDNSIWISKEIQKIIFSIQFQDITKQRIEHVIQPLNQINKEILMNLKQLNNIHIDIDKCDMNDIKIWLNGFYSMKEEKKVLDKII